MDIQLEYFPNKTRIKNGKRGQKIKLPLGIHPRSGKRSCFIDDSGQPYLNQALVLDEIARCRLGHLKRVISANLSDGTGQTDTSVMKEEKLGDSGEFGELDNSVKAVLESCPIILYLCQKARKTQYLGHFERLTILYVFGHMGETGNAFVHQVMSYTMNYSYQTTEKFIRRRPDKPISCAKLREQYKQISAELGCSCAFKRTKNCYPSPVLHALKLAEDDNEITIPVSRTLTESKAELMKNEINVSNRVQTIAERMLELRRQMRGLDKNIRKCEKELEEIYDDINTNSVEIKMGLLVRRKHDGRYEWIIEL